MKNLKRIFALNAWDTVEVVTDDLLKLLLPPEGVRLTCLKENEEIENDIKNHWDIKIHSDVARKCHFVHFATSVAHVFMPCVVYHCKYKKYLWFDYHNGGFRLAKNNLGEMFLKVRFSYIEKGDKVRTEMLTIDTDLGDTYLCLKAPSKCLELCYSAGGAVHMVHSDHALKETLIIISQNNTFIDCFLNDCTRHYRLPTVIHQ